MARGLLSALIVALLLSGCGDDGGGPDPAEVCPDLCQKQEDCDLLGNATYQECVDECLGFAEYMLNDYLDALNECTSEKTCAELTVGVTSQGLCYQENVDLCTTDTSGYVEAACLLELSCDGIDDPTTQQLEDCTDRMHGDGNILICFEPSKINELESCVQDATECTPNPVNKCVLDVTGLVLGQGGPGA